MKYLLVFAAMILTGCNAYLSGAPASQSSSPFEKPTQGPTFIDYALVDRVVFQANCVECHRKMKTYEGVIARLSEIENAVFVQGTMPKSPQSLDACESALLKYWIQRGVPKETNDPISNVPECVAAL